MIVDVHTHVFPSFFRRERDRFFDREPEFEILYRDPGSRLEGVGRLLETMDEEGVDKSVIFGFPWRSKEHYRRHNDYILEAVTREPDRLAGFCCFSPGSEEGSREAERCLDAGLSGVGELAVYGSGLSRVLTADLEAVMEVCLRRDAPVMVHTNEPVGHRYPGKTDVTLREIYALVSAFPRNKLILAHWGGGLFFYTLMKKEVRGALRNVWVDTAASPYLYDADIYGVAGNIFGFDRILFGSDYPLLKPGRYLEEIASAGLPAESVSRVLGRNALALLRGLGSSPGSARE